MKTVGLWSPSLHETSEECWVNFYVIHLRNLIQTESKQEWFAKVVVFNPSPDTSRVHSYISVILSMLYNLIKIKYCNSNSYIILQKKKYYMIHGVTYIIMDS